MENLVVCMSIDKNFWSKKKVLLTGHTGFKGTWTLIALNSLNAKVCGVSLEPLTDPSFYSLIKNKIDHLSFIQDIRDINQLKKILNEFEPEIIIHMAAQPLVRKSYDDPVETFSTNVLGLVNLLEVARHSDKIKSIINVTSDKCYENIETTKAYTEQDRLGGHDPYSNSKACAELVTSSFFKSFYKDRGVGVATARAGNVIGGGDWSQDRLIPDYIRAYKEEDNLKIRNKHSVRPWQHVIEPIIGYLNLAQKLYQDPLRYSEAWNFGPDDHDVVEVDTIIAELQKHFNSPVLIKYSEDNAKHEAKLLMLDTTKVKKLLHLENKWNYRDAVKHTADWYKAFFENKEMLQVSLEQLNLYMER